MLRDFHGISLMNYTGIGGSDIQGALAVGQNLNISTYSIAAKLHPPSGSTTTRNDLVVCGKLTFASGAVLGGGNAVYVDPSSSIRYDRAGVVEPGVFQQVGGTAVT